MSKKYWKVVYYNKITSNNIHTRQITLQYTKQITIISLYILYHIDPLCTVIIGASVNISMSFGDNPKLCCLMHISRTAIGSGIFIFI